MGGNIRNDDFDKEWLRVLKELLEEGDLLDEYPWDD